MFGNSNNDGIQTEETTFHTKSPYAISKLYAYWITNNYKERKDQKYDRFFSNIRFASSDVLSVSESSTSMSIMSKIR